MAQQSHRRMVGDTLTALDCVLSNARGPVDLTSLTAKYLLVKDDADATSVVAETSNGVTKQPTQTFTAIASTDRLYINGHGLSNGDQVIVASAGTLPAGLSASTRYFVSGSDLNSFQLSRSGSGAPIDITDAGTGSHTLYLVGHVQITLPTEATANAGRYRLWVKAFSGTSADGYPNTQEGLYLEVMAYGG